MSVNRHQKRSEDSGWGSPIFRSEEKETPVNAEKEQPQRQNKDRMEFPKPSEHRTATCWGSRLCVPLRQPGAPPDTSKDTHLVGGRVRNKKLYF